MQAADTRHEQGSLGPEATIYFDGACPLCSVEINHYKTLEGSENLRFVDVSRDDVDTGPDLTTKEARQRFHVRRADGTVLSGARAFVETWTLLPKWRPAAKVARLPGVMPLLELGYRAFLPLRPMLAKIASRLGAKPMNPS